MNTAPGQNFQPPVTPTQSTARWVGCIMFLAGAALAYFFVIAPLLAASRHEDDISLSEKGVFFAPGLMAFGLILLIMGNQNAGRLFGSRQNPRPLGVVICLATAGVGILLYEWLKSTMKSHGYVY